MLGLLASIRFLFMAPVILGFLTLINLMTSPGVWWVQWAALGLGIAWVIKLFKVVRTVIVAGGLAALGYFLWNRYGDRINKEGFTYKAEQPQPVRVNARLPQ
jgi:hypothetical protein